MMNSLAWRAVAIAAVASVLAVAPVFAQNQMSFFVTSAGPGDGANLGGLVGADAHCQQLAAAAGAGNRTWVAYLSTQVQARSTPVIGSETGRGTTPAA